MRKQANKQVSKQASKQKRKSARRRRRRLRRRRRRRRRRESEKKNEQNNERRREKRAAKVREAACCPRAPKQTQANERARNRSGRDARAHSLALRRNALTGHIGVHFAVVRLVEPHYVRRVGRQLELSAARIAAHHDVRAFMCQHNAARPALRRVAVPARSTGFQTSTHSRRALCGIHPAAKGASQSVRLTALCTHTQNKSLCSLALRLTTRSRSNKCLT